MILLMVQNNQYRTWARKLIAQIKDYTHELQKAINLTGNIFFKDFERMNNAIIWLSFQ